LKEDDEIDNDIPLTVTVFVVFVTVSKLNGSMNVGVVDIHDHLNTTLAVGTTLLNTKNSSAR